MLGQGLGGAAALCWAEAWGGAVNSILMQCVYSKTMALPLSLGALDHIWVCLSIEIDMSG